jgi:hypothetical protein
MGKSSVVERTEADIEGGKKRVGKEGAASWIG